MHPSVTCGDSFFSENGNPFVAFADISPKRGISSMGAKILSHIRQSERIPQSASPPAPFDKGAFSLPHIHKSEPERSRPFPTNSQTRNELLLIKEPLAATTFSQLSTLISHCINFPRKIIICIIRHF